MLKNCIMTSDGEAIGRVRKKQPDWFIDATDVLAPLLDDKAKAHQRYLQSLSSSAKKAFLYVRDWLKRL